MAPAQPQRDQETRDADSALRLLVRLLARVAAREAMSAAAAAEGAPAQPVGHGGKNDD